jgi:hypothetical protein
MEQSAGAGEAASNQRACDTTNHSLSHPKQAATEPGSPGQSANLQEETTASMTLTNTAQQNVPGAGPQQASKIGAKSEADLSSKQASLSRKEKIQQLLKQLRELRAAAVANANNRKSPITDSNKRFPIPSAPVVKDGGWQTPAANSASPLNLQQSKTGRNQSSINYDPRSRDRRDNMARPPAQSLNRPHRKPHSHPVSQSRRTSPFQPPKHVIDKLQSQQAHSPITKGISNKSAAPEERKCGECPPQKKNPDAPISSVHGSGNIAEGNQAGDPSAKYREMANEVEAKMKLQPAQKPNLSAAQAPVKQESHAGPAAQSKPQKTTPTAEKASQERKEWRVPASRGVRQPINMAPNRGDRHRDAQ